MGAKNVPLGWKRLIVSFRMNLNCHKFTNRNGRYRALGTAELIFKKNKPEYCKKNEKKFFFPSERNGLNYRIMKDFYKTYNRFGSEAGS